MVKDATRDRHALVHTKDEWLPPLHLELELSLEHEEELVFVLVAVPVDELALDHGKSDDGVIHARERLIHPRLIPRALCGDVDLRKLTVLVVISDVVVLHTHLPVALDCWGNESSGHQLLGVGVGAGMRAAGRRGTASASTTPRASPRPTKTTRDPSSSPHVGCSPRTSHAVRIPTTGTSSVKGATVDAG